MKQISFSFGTTAANGDANAADKELVFLNQQHQLDHDRQRTSTAGVLVLQRVILRGKAERSLLGSVRAARP